MPEVRTRATPYLVTYLCDKCGIGSVNATGQLAEGYPPSFYHVCVHCGQRVALPHPYPCVSWEEDGREIARVPA